MGENFISELPLQEKKEKNEVKEFCKNFNFDLRGMEEPEKFIELLFESRDIMVDSVVKSEDGKKFVVDHRHFDAGFKGSDTIEISSEKFSLEDLIKAVEEFESGASDFAGHMKKLRSEG